MKKLGIIVAILLAIGIASAVILSIVPSEEANSNQTDISKQQEQMKEEESVNNGEGNTDDGGLTFHLEEKPGDTHTKNVTYTVKNEGEKTKTLSFSTSQRYEYELVSQDDGLIERFSDGRGFMQVVEDIKLAPGEELSYDISIPSLDPGEYTLTVFLTAKDMIDSKASIQFVIE